MTKERENPARPEGKSGEKMLERMNRSHGPLRDFGLPLLSWRPDMRILDVGCGGGATIAEMLNLSADSVIDGIDYSQVSVRQSEELNKKDLGSRCNICQADVAKLPFAEDTYDLVTAVETVYFWPDIDGAFKEIFRVLKHQGVFAILNEGSDPEQCDWPPVDGFMRIYRPEELEELLKKAGFQAIKTSHGPGQMICVTGMK
ncbi:MAG TPA: class I SAM-dependent methyltransferase [Candidatus Blautia faecavium]|uniref:Class I SAM-dependent methyltransferase n=1 Tax=Candidatus Blautia faecavium TaxID=2838487 RepID=A0A9D2RWQ8_9FIRM|nr:class I SAM-dependent methyltransferase [Candidatus Blautia faecavium]